MLIEVIPKISAEQMEARQKEKGYGKYKHRCSNAGTERCLRMRVYHALGIEPEPFPDRFSLVLDDSSWHEELSADWIRSSVYRLHSTQMKLTTMTINGVEVGGHIDGLITDPDGNDMLWEHKAINHFTFQAYETGDLIPYDYITQCCMYIVGLEKDTGKWLPALLMIKNKNTSQYLEYHIEYDDQTDVTKVNLCK